MADTTLASTAVAVLDELFPDKVHGVDAGRRYHRIWKESHGQKMVDFFIEPATGGIFKAAGWKAPANGVRFTVESTEELEELLRTHADPYGGWLYVR